MVHRVIRRHQKRRDKEQALIEAYAKVDIRDAGYDRVTGRYTQPGHVDPRFRREHHHMSGRNVAPEDRANPKRIFTTFADAHKLLHAGLLLVEGDDADGRLIFHWSEQLDPKDRPFQIRSKRWSQNDEDVA